MVRYIIFDFDGTLANTNGLVLDSWQETLRHYLGHELPERVIELAVKGMLPKNHLGAQMYRKLSVYAGAEHPHAAQKPEELKLN